jgi:hypothetical protein
MRWVSGADSVLLCDWSERVPHPGRFATNRAKDADSEQVAENESAEERGRRSSRCSVGTNIARRIFAEESSVAARWHVGCRAGSLCLRLDLKPAPLSSKGAAPDRWRDKLAATNAGKELPPLFSRNREFALNYDAASLSPRPQLRLVVIACMDTRITLAALGPRPQDAHFIRNAGGIVTDDVLRSLFVSGNE